MGAGPAPIGRQSPVFRRKWAEGPAETPAKLAKGDRGRGGTRRRREGAAPPLMESSMVTGRRLGALLTQSAAKEAQ